MFHKNIIDELEKEKKNIIDELENDDDNQDLHRWWFESRCSNKKMIVTARSWEEVVKDPRFKPWKFSFIFVVFVNKLKNWNWKTCLCFCCIFGLTTVVFPIENIKHRKNCEYCPGHYLIVNYYSSMSWLKFRNLSVIVNCVTKSLIH